MCPPSLLAVLIQGSKLTYFGGCIHTVAEGQISLLWATHSGEESKGPSLLAAFPKDFTIFYPICSWISFSSNTF
jgi:hypothetical protein